MNVTTYPYKFIYHCEHYKLQWFLTYQGENYKEINPVVHKSAVHELKYLATSSKFQGLMIHSWVNKIHEEQWDEEESLVPEKKNMHRMFIKYTVKLG